MKELTKPIYVTQPFLPPLEEFNKYLVDIWDSKWVTNNGKYHQHLEKALCEYLEVKHISLFANGTLALITALQALKITGEVITTPFSFVATTNALWWNNITPVFVDIEPHNYNIDASKIESAITQKTTAILPVHVFGNPANVSVIKQIADNYGLKVIYDACHAFGVKLNGESILNFGDLSILSFHATKVFNTFEGGAIISPDSATKKRIDYLKNFGFADETKVVAPGINGKMDEFQAALGLLQLKYIDEVILKREMITEEYRKSLTGVSGIEFIDINNNVKQNYSYFPILIDESKYGRSRNELYTELKKHNIFSRRYFYPLISQFPIFNGLDSSSSDNLPNAELITEKILCLPIYPEMELEIVHYISSAIKEYQNKKC